MNYFSRFSNKCLMALSLTLAVAVTARAATSIEWVDRWGLVFQLVMDDENYENSEAILMGLSPYESIDYASIGYEEDSVLLIPDCIYGEYYAVPLTTIMNGAFSDCQDLKYVVIPPSVKTIQAQAFTNSSIAEINFDGYMTGTPDPITIGEAAFKGCKRLRSLNFDRPILEFSPYMCMSCPSLENVGISNHYDIQLQTIGACAFANCTGLIEYRMPYYVKTIGSGAFANCHNMRQCSLNNGVTYIGRSAFAECHQLRYASLPASLTYLGRDAYLNCRSLTQIIIPQGLVDISDYAFCGCTNLTDLRLHDGIQTIGKNAFAGCSNWAGINLPSALTTIGQDAFLCGDQSCQIWPVDKLRDSTSLDICVAQWTYSVNNGNFDHVSLGSNVTSIGDRAFAGHVLNTVSCMAPAPPVYANTDQNEYVFCPETYANAVLRVPRVLVDTYRNTPGWSRFVNIEGLEVMGNGDVDGDNALTITDVTTIIDLVLSGQADDVNLINADTDGDGVVSITDVTNLIDALLNV